MGKKRGERITRRCHHCGKRWRELLSQVTSGRARYCGAPCKYAARSARAVETRACRACGKEFMVGGRGNPPKTVRLCSPACQRAARYRAGKVSRRLAPGDLGYFAGVLDGEGSIMIVKHHESITTLVSVTNTGRPLLEWLVEKTGIGRISRQYDATPQRKATWMWRASGDGAHSILKQVARHLTLKRERAEIAIECQERLRDPALKADRTWQHRAMAQMRLLNRRGPAV